MGRHWTRPHSEASASRFEVRFPASSPYALACGGIAHAAAGSRHRWHRHSGLQRRLHLPEDRPQDSPLFWNYLTFSDGLLTVYEVAREFEFNFLQQAVSDVCDSLRNCAKSPHLAEIFASTVHERDPLRSAPGHSRGFLSGRQSGGGLSGFRPRCVRAGHDEFWGCGDFNRDGCRSWWRASSSQSGNPEFGRRLSSSDAWGEAERLLLRRPSKPEDAAGQQRLPGELGRLATVDDPLDELGREKGQTNQAADVLLADAITPGELDHRGGPPGYK